MPDSKPTARRKCKPPPGRGRRYLAVRLLEERGLPRRGRSWGAGVVVGTPPGPVATSDDRPGSAPVAEAPSASLSLRAASGTKTVRLLSAPRFPEASVARQVTV